MNTIHDLTLETPDPFQSPTSTPQHTHSCDKVVENTQPHNPTVTNEVDMSDNPPLSNFHPNSPNQTTIRKDLSNFIEEQARVFNARLAEAQHVINQFTTLYESISDPEIRAAMNEAAVGIKEQLRAILTGDIKKATNPSQPNRKTLIPKTVEQKKPTKTKDQTAMPTGQYKEQSQTNQGASANKNIKSKAATQKTWTEIVRRRPAKNVVDLQTQEKFILPSIPPENTPKVISKPDPRLFLRMGQDHPWRRVSPHYIKISLAEKLKVASSAITQVTKVNSGYAVSAVSEIMRNALLTQAHRLEKTELKLEPASKWVSLLAPNVPDKLFSISGTVSDRHR
ncbi:putative eka-like protein [Erysiphe necator]|uniref:Putative eka-like protein n=1 Tax=Uncinula necator TaxID=52586 RepID=A0A0B1NW19_UNCNE|nr:putative eka-like protein [Erysiphe necator]